MEDYKKLDRTLDYIYRNQDEAGIEAIEIYKNLGKSIGVSDPEQWKILMKLENDGLLKRHEKIQRNGTEIISREITKIFSTTFDGKVFLDNGGYKVKFTIYKRERLHGWVNQWFNILWKPFAIVIGILTIIKLIFSVIDRFG